MLALLHFPMIKAFVVAPFGVLNAVVVGIVGLYDGHSLSIVSSGATCNLS